MPAYIITDLSRLQKGDFSTTANNIITACSNIPEFASLKHKWPDIKVDYDAYIILDKERLFRSPNDTEKRNDLRAKIELELGENGKNIILLFPNDKDIQESSNFPKVKSRNTDGAPSKPYDFKADNTEYSGEIKLRWKGSANAIGHTIKYRPKDTTDPWMYKAGTKAKFVVIDDLEPGVLYEFWVEAIGAKKNSNYGGPKEHRAM